MSSRAARHELPGLAQDLEFHINKFEKMGPLDEDQAQLLDGLQRGVKQLTLVKIGIRTALNKLQYEIDYLGQHLFDQDERLKQLETMLDLIAEFLESPRYVL